jgi:Terminase large subunit, T4likevirus-type, N-terminal
MKSTTTLPNSWRSWPIGSKLKLRDSLVEEARRRGIALAGDRPATSGPYLDPQYCPHKPHPPQERFLALDCREALYGGAAGGGKSDTLLMAALQYAHVPGYSALILRRTYADLSLPGAIMSRSHEWLRGTQAAWNDQRKTWTFPSGATLTFGYMEQDSHRYRYQGAEFAFVGWDELTQFSEAQYLYLLSRLRRTTNSPVPLRVRSASNPGGSGHQWVMERFPIPERGATPEPLYESADTGRVFVPARLRDNPSLDEESYRANLAELDEATRAQLEDGDWHAVRGKFFSEFSSDEWPKGHMVEPFDVPSHWRMYGGLDWGYDAPMAFLLAAFDEEGNAYVVDELYKRQTDDDDMAALIASTIEAQGRSLRDVPIASDPSMWADLHVRRSLGVRGERRIEAYIEAGLNVFKADNARVDGWANMRRYLSGRKIALFRRRTVNLERTIPMLDPDKKHPEDLDTKQEDHAADGLRYLLQQRPIAAGSAMGHAMRDAERREAERHAAEMEALRPLRGQSPMADAMLGASQNRGVL